MNRRRARTRLALSLVALSAAAAAADAQTLPTAAAPATAPSARAAASTADDAASPAAIDRAVADLGDDDFATRQSAARRLWRAGDAAAAALDAAAQSPDPEVAARAAAARRDARLRLSPDAPPALRRLVEQYAAGDADARVAATDNLARLFPRRLAMIARLAADEPDPRARANAEQFVAAHAEAPAVYLATGDAARARDLIAAQPLPSDDAAALAAQDRRPAPPGPTPARSALAPAQWQQRVLLDRAAGDLDAAARDAAAADDPEMIQAVALLRGDYRAAAEAAERVAPAAGGASDRDGWAAGLWSMAGDGAKREAALARLRGAAAAAVPGRPVVPSNVSPEYVAHALTLLGLPDEGLRLMAAQNPPYAAQWQHDRLNYSAALDLLRPAAGADATTAAVAAAGRAALLDETGDAAGRDAALADADRLARGGGDASAWAAVVRAETDAGLDAAARDDAAEFLARPGADPDAQAVVVAALARASDSDEAAAAAAAWWPPLRARFAAAEPARRTVDRLCDLLANKVPAGDLVAWATDAAAADEAPASGRRALAVARTLYAAGADDAADALLRRAYGATDDPALLRAVGARRAEQGRWADAADAFADARDVDPSDPVGQLLYGWAASRAGRAAEGEASIALARAVVLGRAEERFRLAQALRDCGYADAARQELELCVRLEPPTSAVASAALQQLARDAADAGDFAAAADRMARSLLVNLLPNFTFTNPTAYLSVPDAIHTYRARAALAAGRPGEAAAEAARALDGLPGDVDVPIALVPAFAARGEVEKADALYARVRLVYEKILIDSPANAQAHNSLGWLEVRCGRDLPDAMQHARLAVKLSPGKSAFLDTLAAAYAAGGDYRDALDYETRADRAEPGNAYIAKQVQLYREKAGAGRE